MDPVMEDVVQRLELNARLYKEALAGLSREQLNRRCGPDSSPAIWLAGHLASGRYRMAELAGVTGTTPWQELFKRHSKIVEPASYPEVAEIEREWLSISEQLKQRLRSLTDTELDTPSPITFPVGDKSVRAGLSFLVWHETYHIGQMGFIRKWLGFQSIVS